jgi:hypothetical protein
MDDIKFLLYTNVFDEIKPTYMVKITLVDNYHKESFWVWVESVNQNKITGIICNKLISNVLEIGQTITFDKFCVKELSNRSYTKEETEMAINLINIGNNPVTKYFESLNVKFSST